MRIEKAIINRRSYLSPSLSITLLLVFSWEHVASSSSLPTQNKNKGKTASTYQSFSHHFCLIKGLPLSLSESEAPIRVQKEPIARLQFLLFLLSNKTLSPTCCLVGRRLLRTNWFNGTPCALQHTFLSSTAIIDRPSSVWGVTCWRCWSVVELLMAGQLKVNWVPHSITTTSCSQRGRGCWWGGGEGSSHQVK